jgi:hypothetical protein
MGIHPQLANVDMPVYGDLAVGRVIILKNPRAPATPPQPPPPSPPRRQRRESIMHSQLFSFVTVYYTYTTMLWLAIFPPLSRDSRTH